MAQQCQVLNDPLSHYMLNAFHILTDMASVFKNRDVINATRVFRNEIILKTQNIIGLSTQKR
jgi:hypothetical protein